MLLSSLLLTLLLLLVKKAGALQSRQITREAPFSLISFFYYYFFMVVYVCYWVSLLFLIYLTDLLNKAYKKISNKQLIKNRLKSQIFKPLFETTKKIQSKQQATSRAQSM